MTRLLVHVEGFTEERFVHEVLKPHLHHHGYSRVGARLMGDARQRDKRGGIRGWPEAKRSIVGHLLEDPRAIAATMVDYYGLPKRASGAWPGRAAAERIPVPGRAAHVEEAICRALKEELGGGFRTARFAPCVTMHEFEALLFSDCEKFAGAIEHPELAPKFQAIVDAAGGPEAIDDAPNGAPSKRIDALVPEYRKSHLGALAALDIGLDKIRAACPHFHAWLTRLEELPATLR